MKYLITENGYKRLKKELEELKERRSALIREAANEKKEVKITKSAGYDLVNEELRRITQRIDLLESVLENSKIIYLDEIPRDGCCHLGTYVQLKVEDGRRLTFQIVHTIEVQLLDEETLCSVVSPLGKGVINKREGDNFIVETPDGELEHTLLAVRYEEIKEIIPEQIAEELVEEIEVPEPQPAPIPPVAAIAEDAAEKIAEPEETITEKNPAPVAPVEEAPTLSAPQEKTTFWTAALSWTKKLFK